MCGMSQGFRFLSAIFIFLLVLTCSHYGNINNQDFYFVYFIIFSMMKRLIIVGQVSSGQDKQKLVVYFSLDK